MSELPQEPGGAETEARPWEQVPCACSAAANMLAWLLQHPAACDIGPARLPHTLLRGLLFHAKADDKTHLNGITV